MAALAACRRPSPFTAARTPSLNVQRLNGGIGDLARTAAPAVLGVGLINFESGEHFTLNGDRPFPMQSLFKPPLALAVLSEVEGGRLALAETFGLRDEQLSPPWSPIAAAWPARRNYTTDELLTAAVVDSDNTAADVLMKRIGGPGAVTAWLQSKAIDEIRIDRYEREIQPDVYGMASFRAGWRGAAAFDAARDTVPAEQRRRAMTAYMDDPRDTATPRGMLDLLAKLNAGELIGARSRQKLIALMSTDHRGDTRLKAGFPDGVRFAHKTGASGTDQGLNAATNDAGILTLADDRRYGVAVFLSGSTLDTGGRDSLLARVGGVIGASLGRYRG